MPTSGKRRRAPLAALAALAALAGAAGLAAAGGATGDRDPGGETMAEAGAMAPAMGREASRTPVRPAPERRAAPEGRPAPDGRPAPGDRPAPDARPAMSAPWPEVGWRESIAVGVPTAGELVRGVRLPREGRHYFTWDPVERTSPNQPWRRWGTDHAIKATLRVLAEHRRAHPRAPRLGVGDLSRPRGGDFGTDYGPIGHVSHQNGLDVDVYYPLKDGRERAPLSVDEIDLGLSQDLVDRFVAAGAETVFVGPATGLTGPPDVVQAIPNHDNHLHVRFPAEG